MGYYESSENFPGLLSERGTLNLIALREHAGSEKLPAWSLGTKGILPTSSHHSIIPLFRILGSGFRISDSVARTHNIVWEIPDLVVWLLYLTYRKRSRGITSEYKKAAIPFIEGVMEWWSTGVLENPKPTNVRFNMWDAKANDSIAF